MKTHIIAVASLAAFFSFFYAPSAPAECNLKLAIVAGQYIAELEKSKLTKYQNSSVCEALDYEFWNCSKAQKSKIEKSLQMKEVLGTYCQPHLRPQNVMKANELMKGAELYSWKEPGGYFWYAILPGTNRRKTTKEIAENKISEGFLKATMAGIPVGTQISWNSANVQDRDQLEFQIPTGTKNEIQAEATKAKLDLKVD